MKKFITILAAAIATCGTIGAYAAEGNVNVEKKELAPGKKSHDNVRDFKANATSGGEVILDETFSFCKGSESAPIAIEVDDNMVAPAEMMGGKEGFGGEGLKQADGAIFVGFEIGDGFLQTPEFFDTDAVTVEFEVKPASKINGTDDLVIMAGNTDEEYMADGTAVRCSSVVVPCMSNSCHWGVARKASMAEAEAVSTTLGCSTPLNTSVPSCGTSSRAEASICDSAVMPSMAPSEMRVSDDGSFSSVAAAPLRA